MDRRSFNAAASSACLLMAEPAAPLSGDAVIRAKAGVSDIVITTTSRLAGAIHSLKWNGMEFIDSLDHGRQLQSACSFDMARPGPFWAECFNPTEAGSRLDHTGNKTTSRLTAHVARDNILATKCQMAFWLAPGEKSSGRPALNTTTLSNHHLGKIVRIGHEGLPHAIEYIVTFGIPSAENHTMGQFEALTGYMPPEFSRFLSWNPATGKIAELNDGPGEQSLPVIFTTTNEQHAMGIYTPFMPSCPSDKPSYGRFRFPAEKVVKWNCVFRVRNFNKMDITGVSLRMFVSVGSLADVVATQSALRQKYTAQ